MSRNITIYSNFIKNIQFNRKNVYRAKKLNISYRNFSILNCGISQLKINAENNNQTQPPTVQLFRNKLEQTRKHHRHECVMKLDCWKCGRQIDAEMEQFICACGVVQPPIPSRSYFQIFGMNEHFDIDLRSLKERHQRLQILLHPDKCANKSDAEKSFSDKHSSIVNEAYHILQQPLTRGLYLLHINPQDDQLESEIDVDNDFLAAMMDLNESVMECGDEEGLLCIEMENDGEMEALVDEVSKDFLRGDHASAKQHLLRLKYLKSASDRIREIKRELNYRD